MIEERFKLVLCDFSEGLCAEWKKAFEEYPEVEIKYGRFEDVDYDCVVSPANSFGLMDGSIDEAIAMKFGQQMVDRVQAMIIDKYGGEQPVGTSEIVLADEDGEKFVAVTPTMIIPELISGTNNVYMAMKAMLLAVEAHNKRPFVKQIKTVVCSGFGTGAGRVPFPLAARDMANAYDSFIHRPKKLSWQFGLIRYNKIKNK